MVTAAAAAASIHSARILITERQSACGNVSVPPGKQLGADLK